MPVFPRRVAKARSDTIPRCSFPRMLRATSDSHLLRPINRLRAVRSLRGFVHGSKQTQLCFRYVPAIVVLIFLYFAMFKKSRSSVNTNSITMVRKKIEQIRTSRERLLKSPPPKPSLRPRRKKRERQGERRSGHHTRMRRLQMIGPVEPSFHMQEAHVGTFPNARKIGIMTIAVLQPSANRFDTPWQLPPRVETLSFQASGNRILFSTFKQKSSGGLGHGIAVLNAELSTALNLGISYTHRVGLYGAPRNTSSTIVEDLFGWGVGEVPRLFVEKEICVTALISNREDLSSGEQCPICTVLKQNKYVHRIVPIPSQLSYGCVSCHTRQMDIRKFLDKWGGNNTLYQMAPDKCDEPQRAPDFSLSQRYLYWKYWDLHSNASFGMMPKKYEKTEGQQWVMPGSRRNVLQLKEHELTIAIHAKRGEFFFEKRRHMISSETFIRIIRQVMRAVHTVGGIYSRMPVAIIVFSEGQRARTGNLQDQSRMDGDYYDSDGTVRTAPWFHERLVRRSTVGGNETHSCRDSSRLFPSGVRVEMRVGGDVSTAFHELASADVFIGSETDLSQYAVRMVSRAGLQMLPGYLGGGLGCCVVRYNGHNGSVRKKKSVIEFWRLFAIANEQSARRAVQDWDLHDEDEFDCNGN